MAAKTKLTYLSARDLFTEIRATDGWLASHGVEGHDLIVWAWREANPPVKAHACATRDEWLWLRDKAEASFEHGVATQQRLPLPAEPTGDPRPPSNLRAIADARARADRAP